MFCEQCGKQIKDDAKFCKYCGSPTGGAVEVKREDPAAEIKQEAPALAEEVKKEKKFSLPKREKKEKKEKKAEKTAGKGKLKKILLGIILLVVAVLGIRAGVNYYLSNKIVGQIPDPIEYFGMAPDEDKEFDSYTHRIIFRSEENVGLKEKAKGYIALLKSGAYPFDLGSENAFQSGDFNCYFSYSGNENIGHAWIRTIEIEYYDKTNGRDNYAVWITIHDSGNFELVSVEQGESSGVAEQQEEPPAIPVVEEQKEPTPTVVVEDEPEEEDFFETCKTCFGNGKCSWCNGSGHKTKFQAGIGHVDQTCTGCFGDGDCSSCGGSGMKRDT
ncbi:MAG: zinc-ribbon domain-containing protein [Anaerotignum sp.]|nr:zinc-ribbon domain-containing protein [Anaerotignum sp.]